jgi:uracil-DNA glycosylase family 4
VPLTQVHHDIVTCTRCERLRNYCAEIARVKRAAFRDDIYWARPVPGFGDPNARVLILGLAPAAHGANRTGRVFTGDGVGGSGDFLMAALHRHGFASLPTSRSIDDGLELKNAFIAAAVRCAPPGNKPTPEEIAACLPHLEAEVAQLSKVCVVVALGKIAFDVWWRLMAGRGLRVKPRPTFAHGAVCIPELGPAVIASYHPSRQNTNTGKLTPHMLSSVFGKAAKLASNPEPKA